MRPAVAILRSGDRSAMGYVGTALTSMRGDAALPDLEAIVDDATLSWPSHEAAAYGLGSISDPRALDALLRAFDADRVRPSVAGTVVESMGVDAEVLALWLRDTRRRKIAAWAILLWSARTASRGPIPPSLCDQMLAALDEAWVPYTPQQRDFMRERLS